MATSPMEEYLANNRKVPAEPRASVNGKIVSPTIRFNVQFVTAAIPPPMPLYCNEWISEFTIQGTVPITGDSVMIYSPRNKTAQIPIELGHPSVYHILFSDQHAPFIASVAARQAPAPY